jgi:hypothetical protein
VPGVLGGATLGALAPANEQATQATQLLPSAGGVNTPALPTETSRRNPWTWPLVALISLLAVVLIGTLIAILTPPGGGDDPGTSSPPPSTSSTPTTTPTNNRVALDQDDILGRNQETVQAFLTGLGLQLDAQVGTVAPSEAQVGLAYAVNPTGNVRKGEVITVRFYDAIPDPVATKPSAMTAPAGPHLAGDDVTVSWAIYAGCPAGHPLSGFSIIVSGGDAAVADGNPTRPAGATSVAITLDSTPGGQTAISYTAICTDLESEPSDAITITGN